MPARFALVLLAAFLSLAPALAGPCPSAETGPHEGNVALEVKFITIAEDFFERIGVDFSIDGKKVDIVDKGEEIRKLLKSADKKPIFLDANQTREFLEALQGDIRNNVMHAPKLLVSDGKEGNVRCSEQQFFVTGVTAIRQGEQIAVCPKTETISTGFELAFQPTILKDKQAVAVKVKTSLTSLDGEKTRLFPVVVPVTSTSKEGKDGKPRQPVVLTQNLQQPRITTLAMQGELTIPDGGTALLGGWKRLSEGRCEYGPPVLSKIPYVNRLFKTVGYSRSVENVLVMVTARIVRTETKETAQVNPAKEKQIAELMKQFNALFKGGKYREAEACALRAHELAPENPMLLAAIRVARQQQGSSSCNKGSASASAIVPCSATAETVDATLPKWSKKMEKLVAAYHQACAAGRLDEARKLARQALEIDPTCFGEHPLFKDFSPCPSRPNR